MSNLKLPTLTYGNLAPKLGKTRKLAYATELHGTDKTLCVFHHDTAIVTLREGTGNLSITNGGYGSSTTRNRIHKALTDNQLDYYVTQTNFIQYLICRSTGEKYPNFVSAQFENGQLVKFNNEAVN